MKIQELNESDYDSIRKYLDILTTDDYRNLCMIDFDNKRYVITSEEGVVYIVENDNGQLNPMEIYLDEKGEFLSYTNEEFDYVFASENGNSFIQKTNRLSHDVRHLYFVKEKDKKPLLEYRQFIAENFASMDAIYDLTNHGFNTSSAITYTNYHLPTTLEIHESIPTKHSYKEKVYFYVLIDEENYRRPHIVLGDKYYLLSLHRYPGLKLINVYCEGLGFINSIDTDLRDYMLGTNREINNRKSLVLGYEEYKKGQIHL